jgi:argininosuccinate lyase
MAEPLWAGRLSERPSAAAQAFQSSFSFDSRMLLEDIRGSRAHALMLGERGIIPRPEADALVAELEKLDREARGGELRMPESGEGMPEDVHSFVEQALTSRLGEAGKRLHTARSRNDQVATDMRLYCKDRARETGQAVAELVAALADIAGRHTGTYMPGYTHLQRAQPVTLGYHLCAWCFMLLRDMGRLEDAVERFDYCPLGSGAMAGTTFPIDREMTSRELGFKAPTDNAYESVADRDYCVELASALAVLMTHLSRFCEEAILWSSAEFSFMELSEAWSTGSSIMPQKKNPDYAELIRGKAGRVYGSLMALLAMQKNLPLSYNKDMQEDKEALFDAFDTALACLRVFKPMMESAAFRTANMEKAALGGFTNATDLADYLARKGVPFRDAHRHAAAAVRQCIERGISLLDLGLAEYQAICPAMEKDLYESLSLDACVERRTSQGGPAKAAVETQLNRIRERLDSFSHRGGVHGKVR